MNGFRVLQLDHVELFVPNRHEAAEWYQRVLGLEITTPCARHSRRFASRPASQLLPEHNGRAPGRIGRRR
jgi:catechol 2,3-dioxygenase-like lactoylglutathione lyase family enzyme